MTVVCIVCNEGPVSGGPGYLVKRPVSATEELMGVERYQHGDARACAYVFAKRRAKRKKKPVWVRIWLWVTRQ